MNRKRYIALLILLGLLTGCGAGAGEHIPASAPGSRGGLQSGSSQSELERSVMESASEQPEEHAAKPEPADSAEDSSAEAPDAAVPEKQGAVLEDFSERPEAIHLYEDENITLVLLPIRNVDNGSPELFLQADSRFSHSVRVDVSNFTLNGIELEGFFSEEIAANERKQKQVLNFGTSLTDAQIRTASSAGYELAMIIFHQTAMWNRTWSFRYQRSSMTGACPTWMRWAKNRY